MMQEKLEVLVLGGDSKAMQKVARVKKAKRRRRKRSVARHSKLDNAPHADTTATAQHRQHPNSDEEE